MQMLNVEDKAFLSYLGSLDNLQSLLDKNLQNDIGRQIWRELKVNIWKYIKCMDGEICYVYCRNNYVVLDLVIMLHQLCLRSVR